jgi:hypothetical protein
MRSSYQALFEFGYSFLSPMLNHYVRELVRRERGHKAVCLAREGWLLFKLLNHLSQCGLITLEHAPVYLKVSRTVLLRSQLGEELGWELGLENKFEGTVLDLLIKRYGLKLYEAFNAVPAEVLGFPVSLPRDSDALKQWLTPHASKLKEVVASTRHALAAYLKKLDLSGGPCPMMLDLGYAGTIQKILTQLLDRDTAGLYFIATDSTDKNIGKNTASMAGVFKENVKWQDGYILLERSLLLESLMTAPHGSVIDLRIRTDGDIDFFYGRSAAPQRFYQDLEAVLDGAIQGVEEGFRLNVEYTVAEIELLYTAFATPPSAIPLAVRHLFSIDDDFAGGGEITPMEIFGL